MKRPEKLIAASFLACALFLPACAASGAANEGSGESRSTETPKLTLDELGLRQFPIERDEVTYTNYSLLCMKSEAFLLIDGHRTSPPVVRAPVYDSYCER
jgi:hypothetical protein